MFVFESFVYVYVARNWNDSVASACLAYVGADPNRRSAVVFVNPASGKGNALRYVVGQCVYRRLCANMCVCTGTLAWVCACMGVCMDVGVCTCMCAYVLG